MGDRQGLSRAKRCDVQVAPSAQLQGIPSNARGLPGLLPSPTSASGTSGPRGRVLRKPGQPACPALGRLAQRPKCPDLLSTSSGTRCSHPRW